MKPRSQLLSEPGIRTGEERDSFVYVVPHIPKTAGQSLRHHLLDHLEPHVAFIHLGPRGMREAAERGLAPFAERTPDARRQARVIFGHYVSLETAALVPGRTPRYVTFLREPAARLVSHYNFDMTVRRRRDDGPVEDFATWQASKPRNFMSYWIVQNVLGRPAHTMSEAELFREADEALEWFWLVGITEQFARDSGRLMAALGLPPVGERHNVGGRDFPQLITLDDRLKARLRAEHAVDAALHEQWSRRAGEAG